MNAGSPWRDAAARGACLVPLFWLAAALIGLGSAWMAQFTHGAGIEGMEPSMDGVRVALVLPDGSVTRNAPAAIRLSVAALLAMIAMLLRRRFPVGAPLSLTAIARAAGAGLVFEATFQREPWAIAATVVTIAAAALGVRWSITGGNYGTRLARAILVFTLPSMLASLLMFRGFGRVPWFIFGPLFLESLPVILLAAIGGATLLFPMASPRKWAVTAIAATLMIGAGVQWGGQRARAAERARLHEELASVPAINEPIGYQRLFFQRGISFVRDGFGAYYPKRSAKLFDSLRTYGVDAVALIPYGRAGRDNSRVQFDDNPETRPMYRGLTRLAHARGMRVLLKPQLMVFGSMFPGSLELPDAERRRAWFQSYNAFILHWAAIAAEIHADLFCIGTELVKLSRHQEEWRELIRQVRAVYPGPLVYAATQGEEFENLAFWDALDYIGLNNYYPLPDSLDTSAVVAKVEAVQRRFGKPVIFTETGYASVDGSHRQPWAEPVAPVSLAHQVRCYEALFRAFYNKPWFYGMYWWKLSADGRGGHADRSLTPWRKPAMDTIRAWYSKPQSETASRTVLRGKEHQQ